MFSKITIIWSAWIISSAFFMRQVLNFIKSNLSSVGFKTSISVLFALLSVTAFVYILRVGRNRLKVPRIVLILVVFIAGVIYALGMGIPEEQMHLINFGVLGWLGVMDSEKLSAGRFRPLATALLLCVFVAVIDETIQKFLPYRVGDIRDVFFALIGGIWGAAIFKISHPV